MARAVHHGMVVLAAAPAMGYNGVHSSGEKLALVAKSPLNGARDARRQNSFPHGKDAHREGADHEPFE